MKLIIGIFLFTIFYPHFFQVYKRNQIILYYKAIVSIRLLRTVSTRLTKYSKEVFYITSSGVAMVRGSQLRSQKHRYFESGNIKNG